MLKHHSAKIYAQGQRDGSEVLYCAAGWDFSHKALRCEIHLIGRSRRKPQSTHTQSLAATQTVDDGASSLSQYNLSGIHPFKVQDKVSDKRLQNKMN